MASGEITINQKMIENKEVIYLVYTDVVDSSKKDRSNPNEILEWRKNSFYKQLNCLLKPIGKSLALKSIGDALFILYEGLKSESGKIDDIINILHCVYEAFNTASQDTPIRAIVHKITNHKRGNKIAEYLRTVITSGDIECLTKTLEKDIFGQEVNRAARMLSLVRKGAVLVSQDVVKDIEESGIKAIKGYSIPISPWYNLKLHSPVPVLYMKGVLDCHKEKVEPYVIWELGETEDATLAPEFKANQAFRLINVRLKNSQDLPDNLEKITNETLRQLSLNKRDLTSRFYIDMLWKVTDYFNFQDSSFDRNTRKIDSNNQLKSLQILIPNNRLIAANVLQTEGQARKLNIIFDECGRIEKVEHVLATTKHSAISLLVFTSYPDIPHQNQTRELLSKESEDDYISKIQPQSIPIYKSIRFSEKFLSLNNIKEFSTPNTFKGFSGKKCILLIFQVYNNFLNIADRIETLFKKVDEINDENIKVAFYGLISGLIDGFILYTVNEWEEGLRSILKKLITIQSPINHANHESSMNIYYIIYPVTIFILDPDSTFPSSNENIEYLIKVSKDEQEQQGCHS